MTFTSVLNYTHFFKASTNVFELMDADLQVGGADFSALMLTLIFSLLLGILVNVVLVFGAMLMKAALLLPWLVFQLVVIIVHLVTPVLCVYYSEEYGDGSNGVLTGNGSVNDRWRVLMIFFPLVLGILAIYFWFAVRKLFDEFVEAAKKAAEKAAEDAKPKAEQQGNAFININLGAFEGFKFKKGGKVEAVEVEEKEKELEEKK